MVDAHAPPVVARRDGVGRRLHEDDIGVVAFPAPAFGPGLKLLVAKELEEPLPEGDGAFEVRDIDLDVAEHPSMLVEHYDLARSSSTMRAVTGTSIPAKAARLTTAPPIA